MSKPRAIRWLEEETGEQLDHARPPLTEGKHLSLRVPSDLWAQLEAYAAEREESVSQAARRLIVDGLTRAGNPDWDALDTAIAFLDSIRHAAARSGGALSLAAAARHIREDRDSR